MPSKKYNSPRRRPRTGRESRGGRRRRSGPRLCGRDQRKRFRCPRRSRRPSRSRRPQCRRRARRFRHVRSIRRRRYRGCCGRAWRKAGRVVFPKLDIAPRKRSGVEEAQAFFEFSRRFSSVLDEGSDDADATDDAEHVEAGENGGNVGNVESLENVADASDDSAGIPATRPNSSPVLATRVGPQRRRRAKAALPASRDREDYAMRSCRALSTTVSGR